MSTAVIVITGAFTTIALCIGGLIASLSNLF